MRDRSTLDRLTIGFECRSSWESMEGEGARRWCGECRKHVLDLAQLTGAEIETRLLASRGELCVRLTRRDGRLITAPEPELPLRALVAPPRRAAALAAGVVTACLGALAAERAGSAAGAPVVAAAPQHPQPRPSPPDRMPAGPSGSLRGRLSADGKPLRGAAITARNTFDGSETRTTTAADGAFAFRVFSNVPACNEVVHDVGARGRRADADVANDFLDPFIRHQFVRLFHCVDDQSPVEPRRRLGLSCINFGCVNHGRIIFLHGR